MNGVVDARQCGVIGDGQPANSSINMAGYHPDDAAFLQNCMGIADSRGYHRVSTGGGVILGINGGTPHDHDVTPFPGMELTCGIDATADRDDNDFRIAKLAGAIVLDLQDTIALSSDAASLAGCNVVAGETSGGAVTNPYSPAYWYPDCNPSSTTCDDTGHTANLRSAILEYSAFNPNATAAYPGGGPASQSVGITVTGDKNAVRNVTVMGFGKCYATGGGGKAMIIEHLSGDCDNGLSIVSSSEASQFNGLLIKPFLTNGGHVSLLGLRIINIADNGSGQYRATVDLGGTDFAFAIGDTLWIDADATTHTESAAGRWTVGSDLTAPFTGGPCSPVCQSFTLKQPTPNDPDSRSSGISLNGTANTTTPAGVPPNAITGISTSPGSADRQSLLLVAIGQTVTDSAGCVPAGAVVKDVWPAKGIVYLSAAATCGPNTSTMLTFTDHTPYANASPDCAAPIHGCATVDANERFGDGVFVRDSGGVSAVNCQVYEHLVAYHFYTNTNSSRFTNCATGENMGLPDSDIVGLKIDGEHSSDPDEPDACGNAFVNSVLGQHRTVSVLVQSNCDTPNQLTNVHMTTHTGGRRHAIGLEVDAGTVLVGESHGIGAQNVFKADSTALYSASVPHDSKASLSISSNHFPQSTLYMASADAAASTSGCGNTFAAPTPYLCAPSSFTQLPGGRLSLAQGTSSNCSSPVPPPVMSGDATNASCIFYVPYTSQNVPIYSAAGGTFGLADVGPAGLTLNVNTTNHISGNVYDVFIETQGGSPEMCTVKWTNTTSRATAVRQINGVWVNSGDVACSYAPSLTRDCLPLSCTYAGSFLATADGQTEQQFGPISGSGGGAPCLCLYNAYNHVTLTSASADSSAAYSYSSAAWRFLNGNANNSVTVLDGLQQMQIAGLLNDSLANAGGVGTTNRTAAMGVEVLALPGSAAAPPLVVQANSANKGSYSATLSAPPLLGLWAAYAVESANSGSSGSPSFGGPGFQQLSVQVAD